MDSNHSPWLAQIARKRPTTSLADDTYTDIAVVGAGIAGISTAYFLLKNTDHKVTIVEGSRVAHGATGHNAGQITSYFERQLSDIAEEFGLEMTAQGQAAVDSAWILLEEMYRDARLETPFSQFTGYAGCGDFDEVMVHLKNNAVATTAGINSEELLIAKEWPEVNRIPKEYDGLYTVVPQQDILDLLETTDKHYIATVTARKGVLNSALFCEELTGYMLNTFSKRFTLLEESPMQEVELHKDHAELKIHGKTVHAQFVVLCTNGFEKFKIINKAGLDIDTKFHHTVRGSVGYMAGYLEKHDKSPTAISYLPDRSTTKGTFDSDPYIYLTRRPYEKDNNLHNLICVGGPEFLMDDTNHYSHDHVYPDQAQQAIDDFLHHSYKYAPEGDIPYAFRWHGLMGYTPNGVRLIGPEPLNPILMYNLGCNGVGILPSIYGGKKISQFVRGEDLPPSIFDPKEKLDI